MLHISQKDREYLFPPAGAESIILPSEYIKAGSGDIAYRSIFYCHELDDYEIERIEEVKSDLLAEGIVLDEIWNDRELLKHLYSTGFEREKAVNNIKQSMNWKKETQYSPISFTVLEVLYSGVIYMLGRDTHYRPNVVINLGKVDSKFKKEEIIIVISAFIDLVKRNAFIPGKIERINLILDINGQDLPRSLILESESLVANVAVSNPELVEKFYIYNHSSSFMSSWTHIKRILGDELSRKAEFINKENYKNIRENIPMSQFEKKYGGQLENLKTFWPLSTMALQVPVSSVDLKQSGFSLAEQSFLSPTNVERNSAPNQSPTKAQDQEDLNVSNSYERKTMMDFPVAVSNPHIFRTPGYKDAAKSNYERITLEKQVSSSTNNTTKTYDLDNRDLVDLILDEYENLKTDKYLMEKPEVHDLSRLSARLTNSGNSSSQRNSQTKVNQHNMEDWASKKYLKKSNKIEQEIDEDDEDDDPSGNFCGFCFSKRKKDLPKQQAAI